MPTTQQWVAPESIATALTTELNSLGNGSQSAASSAIDNETDLDEWIDVELVLASLTPTGSPFCLVYILYSLDGTNYEDLSTSALHAAAAALPFTTATGAKRVVARAIPILPLKFKLAVENRSGVSLAASGNTLKYRRFNEQQV